MSEDLTGRVNGYRCKDCGKHTFVVHVDNGVTPMFLACRAEGVEPADAECKGRGVSLMYPPPPTPPHIVEAVAWEWYKPTRRELREMDTAMLDHVKRGGLMLRPLTDAGRAALKAGPS